jgi:hypothetical protein
MTLRMSPTAVIINEISKKFFMLVSPAAKSIDPQKIHKGPLQNHRVMI